MAKEVATIKYIFNSVLNSINQSFLHSVPAEINSLIALLLTALSILFFILFLCLVVGIPYYFIKNYTQKAPHESAIDIFKRILELMYNRIRHPITKGFVLDTVNKSFPFIAILMLILLGWKLTLPMLIFTFLANTKVQEKLNFRLNYWVFAYLLIIVYVHFCLTF